MAIGISRRQVAGRWAAERRRWREGRGWRRGAASSGGESACRLAQPRSRSTSWVGDNIGPGAAFCCVAVGSWLAQIGDAVLELLFQHEGKETARDVAANGLVELMKDRPRGEQALRRSEGPFHPP